METFGNNFSRRNIFNLILSRLKIYYVLLGGFGSTNAQIFETFIENQSRKWNLSWRQPMQWSMRWIIFYSNYLRRYFHMRGILINSIILTIGVRADFSFRRDCITMLDIQSASSSTGISSESNAICKNLIVPSFQFSNIGQISTSDSSTTFLDLAISFCIFQRFWCNVFSRKHQLNSNWVIVRVYEHVHQNWISKFSINTSNDTIIDDNNARFSE